MRSELVLLMATAVCAATSACVQPTCTRHSDCPLGMSCEVPGICVGGPDAAAADASVHTRPDAAVDAAPDATIDASWPDAMPDADPRSPYHADAGMSLPGDPDAAPDAMIDAWMPPDFVGGAGDPEVPPAPDAGPDAWMPPDFVGGAGDPDVPPTPDAGPDARPRHPGDRDLYRPLVPDAGPRPDAGGPLRPPSPDRRPPRVCCDQPR